MSDWSDEHGFASFGPEYGRDEQGGEPDAGPTGNAWADAERRAELAYEFYEKGLWQRAYDELTVALEVNPEQAEWQFGLGLTLDAMQRYEEAIWAYRRVVDLRGEEAQPMTHLGIDLLRAGKPGDALAVLDRLLVIDPGCEEAYCHRILACAMLGDHDEAEVSFYLARQITEECPICLDHMARSLEMRRDDARAIWCWHQVQRIDPDYPEVNLRLARAYQREGKLDRAYTLLMHELSLEPGNISLLVETADVLIAMGKPVEASEKLRRVLELDPSDMGALVRLGDVYLKLGREDLAIAHLEKAHAIESRWPGVMLGLARAAHERGDDRTALRHALAELDNDRLDPAQVVALSHLLTQLGAHPQVVGLLMPLVGGENPLWIDEPKHYIAALLALGYAGLAIGDTPAAIRDLRRAVRMDQDNITARCFLVMAYQAAGRLRRARAVCRRALREHPLDSHLRTLGRKLGWARLRSRLRFSS